jgi:GH25 family lysozyme M1 (1,4-beta-N-acetylmuramidase)
MIAGFDISNYQGAHSVANFQSAKAAGFVFVAIKASEGTSYADPDFVTNWNNAGAAGLVRIAYHFCHPSSNAAAAEVAWFLKCLSAVTMAPGDNVAADVEQATGEVGSWVAAFLGALQAPTGVVRPFIYSGNWFIPGHLDFAPLSGYPLWDAVYNSGNTIPAPVSPWATVTVWQHADNQAVPGFGNVDGDYYGSTIESLQSFGKSGDILTPSQLINLKRSMVIPIRLRNESWPPGQADVDSYATQISDDFSNYEQIITNVMTTFNNNHQPSLWDQVQALKSEISNLPAPTPTTDPNVAKAVKALKDAAAVITADLA